MAYQKARKPISVSKAAAKINIGINGGSGSRIGVMANRKKKMAKLSPAYQRRDSGVNRSKISNKP